MAQKNTQQILLENFQQAPKPVQDYIRSGAYEKFILGAKEKYKLHVDVADRLSNEVLLMLVGITDPTELLNNLLTQVSIPEENLDALFKDLNDQVFIPLREEMRRGGQTQVEQSKKVPPPPSYKPPPHLDEVRPQANVGGPPKPPPPPQRVTLPLQTTIIPANPELPPRPPEQAYATMPRYTAPRPLNRPVPNTGRSGEPPKAVVAPDPAKLLPDHEERHIEFEKAPAPPSINRLATPRPAPSTPPNLPGAMPISSSKPPSPPAAPYTVDPYHEPLE